MSLADEYQLLSERFRTLTASFSGYKRLNLEKAMLQAFSTASLRNVQLWTRDTAQKRNFISLRTDPKERERRILFANAILNEAPTTRPVKYAAQNRSPELNGQKLLEYLISPYIGGTGGLPAALEKIIVDVDGSFTIVYNAYPDENQQVTPLDPSDPEFDGIFEGI